MSEAEFDKRIASLTRKLALMRMAKTGDAEVHVFWRKAHRVKGYSVARHQVRMVRRVVTKQATTERAA